MALLPGFTDWEFDCGMAETLCTVAAEVVKVEVVVGWAGRLERAVIVRTSRESATAICGTVTRTLSATAECAGTELIVLLNTVCHPDNGEN